MSILSHNVKFFNKKKEKKKECFSFSFGKEKKMNECSSCNNIHSSCNKKRRVYIYIGSMKISEETSFFIYLCWMMAEDMAESEPISLTEKI